NGQNLEKSEGNKPDNMDISGTKDNGCNNVVDTPKKDVVDDFRPIISADEFFKDYHNDNNSPWQPLPSHSLEQSPCYPVIGTKPYNGNVCYYCKIHPNIENIHLDSIEQHCRYTEPERHKTRV